MTRPDLVDGIRRECIRAITDALGDAAFADAAKVLALTKAVDLLDEMIALVATHTAPLGRRESRAVVEIVFARLFPVVCAHYLPAVLQNEGATRAATALVRNLMAAPERQEAGADAGS